MDPVSALGVASAAVTFLDVALKSISICNEIRKDAKSATRHNRELESNAETLKGLRTELQSARTNIHPRITDVAESCVAATDKLLEELRSVRRAGKSPNLIKAAFKTLRKEGDVRELESTLMEKQNLLNQVLVQDIWTNLDMLQVEQSKQFATLTTAFQRLILDGANQQRSTQDARLMDNFLNSLAFPAMNERHSNIKQAAPTTLDWIYDKTKNNQENDRKWDNFGQWLRDDSPLYWICGKLGSGKSTLLAHMLEDDRTRQGLSVWSESYELRIISHFFWRPGSELQKSTVGLLRCLLHQICCRCPHNIVRRVSRSIGLDDDATPIWTEGRLKRAIQVVLNATEPTTRYCVFIDGLDEYTGYQAELLDLVSSFETCKSVKLCVSSRPETQLTQKLRTKKQLHLEDLNHKDILRFVDQQIGTAEITENSKIMLVSEITSRAEGVFLWASLVVQAVIRGIAARDNEEMLWKRVNSAPQDMNKLFLRMLEDVDEVHKASLAFFLQFMRECNAAPKNSFMCSVSILAAASTGCEIDDYSHFAEICQRIEHQVVAQSAGLLEVHVGPREWRCTETTWIEAPNRYITQLRQHDSLSKQSSSVRFRCSSSELWPSMLKYETRFPAWVHRSAYDFFFGSEAAITQSLDLPDPKTFRERIVDAALQYIAMAPSYGLGRSDPIAETFPRPPGYSRRRTSYRDARPTLTAVRLQEFIGSASLFYEDSPTETSNTLDRLLASINAMDPSEFYGAWGEQAYDPDSGMYMGTTAFWMTVLFGSGLLEYISSRSEKLSTTSLDLSITILSHTLQIPLFSRTPEYLLSWLGSVSKLSTLIVQDCSNSAIDLSDHAILVAEANREKINFNRRMNVICRLPTTSKSETQRYSDMRTRCWCASAFWQLSLGLEHYSDDSVYWLKNYAPNWQGQASFRQQMSELILIMESICKFLGIASIGERDKRLPWNILCSVDTMRQFMLEDEEKHQPLDLMLTFVPNAGGTDGVSLVKYKASGWKPLLLENEFVILKPSAKTIRCIRQHLVVTQEGLTFESDLLQYDGLVRMLLDDLAKNEQGLSREDRDVVFGDITKDYKKEHQEFPVTSPSWTWKY